MTLEIVLVVAGALFSIGLFGVLARRNIIAVIMSLELMFNGVLVAAIGFSRFTVPAALVGASGDITESAVRSSLTGHAFRRIRDFYRRGGDRFGARVGVRVLPCQAVG